MLYWTHCSHFHFSYIRLWRGRILYSEHARRKLNVIHYTHRRRNEASIIKGITALKQNWYNWKVNDSNKYKMTPILKNSDLMSHPFIESDYSSISGNWSIWIVAWRMTYLQFSLFWKTTPVTNTRPFHQVMLIY